VGIDLDAKDVPGGILKILGVVTPFLWQVKRWSDAQPTISVEVQGGENERGQTFGIGLKNAGKVDAYNVTISPSWDSKATGPIPKLSPADRERHIPISLDGTILSREPIDEPSVKIDFHDIFGRLFRKELYLRQVWDARFSRFFLHEGPRSIKTSRPKWVRDLLRWRKVF
jgi:hypothetical protein